MSQHDGETHFLSDSLFSQPVNLDSMWNPELISPDHIQWNSPEPPTKMTMTALWPSVCPSILDGKGPLPSPPPTSETVSQSSKRSRVVDVPTAPSETAEGSVPASTTPTAVASAKPIKDLHTFLKQVTMRIRRLQTRPSLAQCRTISKWLSAVPTETQNPFILEVAPSIVPKFQSAVDDLSKALAAVEALPVSLRYETKTRTLSEIFCASSDVEIVQEQQQQQQHSDGPAGVRIKREREDHDHADV